MDVYVVSAEYVGEPSTVVGAGAALVDAQAIADRHKESAPGPGWRWTEWRYSDGGWLRDSVKTDGSGFGGVSQAIVKVPLAGMVTTGELPGDLRKPVQAWASGQPVTYAGSVIPSNHPAVDPLSQVYADNARMAERLNGILLSKIHEQTALITANLRRIADPQLLMRADSILVGDGPAWLWLKAGLEKLATHPSDTPLPDPRASAMILGLPVIVDPDMQPDEFHVGDQVFIIGTGLNGIAEGEVIQIDKAALKRAVAGSNIGAGAAVTIGDDGKVYPVKRVKISDVDQQT